MNVSIIILKAQQVIKGNQISKNKNMTKHMYMYIQLFAQRLNTFNSKQNKSTCKKVKGFFFQLASKSVSI